MLLCILFSTYLKKCRSIWKLGTCSGEKKCWLSEMARNARVLAAFRAMRALGISEATVKPVLKNLLKLYDKNWELIEEENYRALADAIFEYEETKVHFALLLIESV